MARLLGCDVISADSRQIYRGMPIGTAVPTSEERGEITHHFLETLDPWQYYSASLFAEQVMELLPTLWKHSPVQVMCGGSMMYVDAVARGLDDLPTISPEVRTSVLDLYHRGGIPALIAELERTDPLSLQKIDQQNHKRLIHAIEITREAGVPYSRLCGREKAARPFRTLRVAIDRDREDLFNRINRRTGRMIERGLIEEARSLYPLRHLNALNTVGYKELFAYFDDQMDLPTATARIAKNTRVYAKKQLTWLKRDSDIIWLRPDETLPERIVRLYQKMAK